MVERNFRADVDSGVTIRLKEELTAGLGIGKTIRANNDGAHKSERPSVMKGRWQY